MEHWGGSINTFNQKDLTKSNLNPLARFTAGFEKGKEMAKEIIDGLERDENGRITESVKFITSSMGTAYQRGFSAALTLYVISHNTEVEAFNRNAMAGNQSCECGKYPLRQKIEGFEIEFTVDIDPFQGSLLFPDPYATNSYYILGDDEPWWNPADEGFFDQFAGSPIPGAKQLAVDSNGKTLMKDHHPSYAPVRFFPTSSKPSKTKWVYYEKGPNP
jgi:hypothetical protein